MRVALVLGTSTGGVGRHVHDLVAGLVAAGHDVLVGCPADVEEHFGFVAAGARHVRLRVADRPHPVRDLADLAALRRVRARADVVHAHGLRAGALVVLAGRRAGAPLVVTLHNATPGGPVLGRVYAVLERLVARGARLVLGVSTDLVDRQQVLGARATGLAVVASPPPSAVVHDRAAVRSELALEPGTSLALAVGRLAPQKGLDLLLDAVALLRGRVDVVTVVAGEGPLRAHLGARIAGEGLPMRLLGHRRDVPDLVAAADVVVSSAVWEGQPVALQEALHAGAPVVATDAGGTTAVLGDAGIVVRNHDAEALADAILEVLGSPERATELRDRALHRATELPTPAQSVRAAIAAYESVLAARPPSDR